MNFFECSVINGTGGSGSKVIVTCDAAFAGTTISCTKGTLVYTQTCPSTSFYQVTFEGLENGTWTISGSAGGQTWTSEVIVEDIAVDLIYGFNWRQWLTEGRVTKTFENLDDILEDEPTLRQLFLVHDSVDYLAETTVITEDVEKIFNTDLAAKWINLSDYALDHFYAVADIKALMDTADKYGYGEWVITDDSTTPPTWGAKGNVPVMTGNNAPYGEAISSGVDSSSANYYAFDGNDSTQYSSNTASTTGGMYLGYKFATPLLAKKVVGVLGVLASAGANITLVNKIQGSNDGTNWVDISNEFSVTIVATGRTNDKALFEVELQTPDYYLYHRLYNVSSTVAQRLRLYSLQFYGRELKVSVPTMTSNTAPFGEAFESSYDYVDSYLLQAWRAFDKDISNALSRFQANGKSNQYLGYTFSSPTVIKLVALTNYSIAARSPKEIKIQYKNGDVWIDATDIITNPTTADLTTFYILSNESQVASRDWRVFILNNYGDASYISIRELQFYGLDYSEKEFEAGTTKKWLYDHGVELETLTITGTGTKNSDYIQLTATNAQAVSTINTTVYSLMRGKVGAHASGTNQLLCGSGSSNFTASNMPNNNSLNVSSINGSNAVGVKQTANGIFDATEFWLE